MSPRLARNAVLLFIVSSLSAGFSALAASPKDFDIVGLKIGQNAEQAKQAIMAYSPTMRFEPESWPRSTVASEKYSEIWARSEADVKAKKYASETSSDFEEYFQLWFGPVTGKAYYIVRKVGNRSKNRVTVHALQKALVSKYGEPHTKMPNMWTWAFRADGSIAKREDGCITSSMGNHAPTPLELSTVCGAALKLTFTPDYLNPTLLQRFTVSLLDHRALKHELEQEQALSKAAADKRDINDMKKFGGNVPRL